MNESVSAVVSRFFNVPEAELSDSFILPPERLGGSISRRVLHAAIKRLAGADLPGVWTATTFGELLNGSTAANGADRGKSAPVIRTPIGAAAKPAAGIDIEEIAEMPWSGDPWSDPFYGENFTASERAYALRQPEPRATLCGMWCAKEALMKCGPEFASLSPAQIEVRHDENGRPRISIEGTELAAELSISHTAECAVAVCVRHSAQARAGMNPDYAVIRETLPRPPQSGARAVWCALLALVFSIAALALALAALARH